MVRLGEVCTFEYGSSLPERNRVVGQYPVVGSNGIAGYHNSFIVKGPTIVIGRKGSAGEVNWIDDNCFPIDTTYFISLKLNEISLRYLFYTLQQLELTKLRGGAGVPGLNRNDAYDTEIPLPPLEEQERIVAELEGYRKVIEGARQVLASYKPAIRIDPEWPVIRFDEAPLEIIDGDRGNNYPKKEEFSSSGYCIFLNTKNVRPDGFEFSDLQFISREKDRVLRKGRLHRGDVVLTTRGTVGNTALYDESVEFEHIRINSGMLIFRPESEKLSSSFLFQFFQSENFITQKNSITSGSAQPQLPIRSLIQVTIPLPPLSVQREIVAELEAERKLVEANRELIRRMEARTKAKLDEVWGG
jgi:restriction endonuclease S subunit